MAGTVICVKRAVVKDVTGDVIRRRENANARLVGTVLCASARLAGTENHVRSPGPVKVRTKQCNIIVRKSDLLVGHVGAMAYVYCPAPKRPQFILSLQPSFAPCNSLTLLLPRAAGGG